MEDIEKLARDYKTALENGSETTLDRIVVQEEYQLEWLNALTGRVSGLTERTVNYLKNIIYRSLKILNNLSGNDSYVPSYHSSSVRCGSVKSNLLGAQINIFVLLDELNLPYEGVAELWSYENRKAALIATL
jgi:hypothetical protein